MLVLSKISLRDGKGKWEESQWDRRHLSMDESPETPLTKEKVKVDNWNGASNKGWIPRHLS